MFSTSMSSDTMYSQYDDHDNIDGFDCENVGICKNARLTTSVDSFTKDRRPGVDDEEWHIAQMFNK